MPGTPIRIELPDLWQQIRTHGQFKPCAYCGHDAMYELNDQRICTRCALKVQATIDRLNGTDRMYERFRHAVNRVGQA